MVEKVRLVFARFPDRPQPGNVDMRLAYHMLGAFSMAANGSNRLFQIMLNPGYLSAIPNGGVVQVTKRSIA